MNKQGGRVLKIIGTAQTQAVGPRVGGDPVFLVGNTSSIKGTKGDTGPAGPAWSPTVGDVADADIASGATGSIEVSPGVFIATYDGAA